MPIKLARKSRKEPRTLDCGGGDRAASKYRHQLRAKLRPIPVTQSGVTSATAMATPAMEFESRSLRVKAPATLRQWRSRDRSGFCASVISGLISLALQQPGCAHHREHTNHHRDRRAFHQAVVGDCEAERQAENWILFMAPITTAVLLLIRPRVAITADDQKIKRWLGRVCGSGAAPHLLSRFSFPQRCCRRPA